MVVPLASVRETSQATRRRLAKALDAVPAAYYEGCVTGAEQERAGHRVAPHTADVIVEAWAPGRAACLEELVRGLVAAFAEIDPATSAVELPFELQPGTDEEAVVGLLDEVLYLLDAEGLVVADVAVDDPAGVPGEGALMGRFRAVPADAVTQTGAVPKGVSRSELALVNDGTTWRCRVVVDV